MLKTRRRNWWLIGIPNMTIAVVSSASILPLTINIKIFDPLLKLLWRNINMFPFLVLMTVIENYYFNRQNA